MNSICEDQGVFRIAAIGDSSTDGFYVDDKYTYPHLLEKQLNKRGRIVEVINAAYGGASIDKELAILKKHVIPLNPDLVILTFVTNDVTDIRDRTREEMIDSRNYLKKPAID